MKVKNAAQVFSQRVSSVMRFLSKREPEPLTTPESAEQYFYFNIDGEGNMSAVTINTEDNQYAERLLVSSMASEECVQLIVEDDAAPMPAVGEVRAIAGPSKASHFQTPPTVPPSSTQTELGLAASAADTADFLLFIDKAFDSINGTAVQPVHGKMLRCAIKQGSSHISFWEEALKVFESIKYIAVADGKVFIPPTVTNWIHTIKGIRYLWLKLKDYSSFRFLSPRNLNQDPLENFFGCVRSQAGRNINPTCTSFGSSFKTLLINNFHSSHSPGSNCEEDESDGALNTLRHLIQGEEVIDEEISAIPDVSDVEVLGENDFSFKENTSILKSEVHSYLAGFVAKKLFKKINCRVCRHNLTSNDQVEGSYIQARAYNPKALVNVNEAYRKLFTKSCEVMHFFLPKLCYKKNIRELLKIKLQKYVLNDVEWTCSDHNLKYVYEDTFVTFYIISWIASINKILRGQDQKELSDPIKKEAYAKYIKLKHKSSKIRKVKQLT